MVFITLKPSLHILRNGFPVLHLEAPFASSVHLALVFNAGTRDERPGFAGTAHFIEHMLFKGTRKRSNVQILNFLDQGGGDVNAYTTKEKICIHASVTRDETEKAFDLLSDIGFHATFPSREIEREKLVISEEIDMYQENPEETIVEEMEKILFRKLAIANPILGYKNSIAKTTPSSIRKFVAGNFTKGRIALSVAGNISETEALALAEKWFSKIKLPPKKSRRQKSPGYKHQKLDISFPTKQIHCLIGAPAFASSHRLAPAFLILNNYLGGPAMNSILNLNIREKFGLAYNIYSFYAPYSDCGTFGLYFSCDPSKFDRVLSLCNKELEILRNKELPLAKVNRIKKQVRGQIILGWDGLLGRAINVAKDYLDFGQLHDLDSYLKMFDRVTPADLHKAAKIIFDSQKMSMIRLVPKD